MATTSDQHAIVTMALHWAAAVAVVAVIATGVYMVRGSVDFGMQFKLQQIHKSLGVLVFALAAVWLVARTVAVPPHPAARQSVRTVHVVVFALLLLAPLSGWIAVSTALFKVPTFVFGALWLPHVPLPESLAGSEAIASGTAVVHALLALALGVGVIVHLVQILSRRGDLMHRMLPWRRW